MKKFLCSFLILITCISVQAQKQDQTPLFPENTVWRLSFLAPALAIEQKISRNITVSAKLLSGIQVISTRYGSSASTEVIFDAYVSLGPRFYTGIEKRKQEGKRVDYFSGTYIELPFTYAISRRGYALGPIFGFQKTLNKRGYFNIGLGIGYKQIDNFSTFGLIGDFGLGIILNTHK